MPYRLGMTGNIGCGKSTVGRMFQNLGADYVDADQIVHGLYQPGSEGAACVVQRFGADVLAADGSVDRAKLGALVIGDPTALADLERLVHPLVRREIRARIASSLAPAIVVDAIKIFESGLAQEMDAVLVVTCTRAQQLERLIATRGYSESEAARRIDAQPPQDEKTRRSDFVIDNSSTIEATRRQVAEVWRRVTTPP